MKTMTCCLKKTGWLLLLISLVGCKKSDTVLETKFFSFETPKGWKIIEEEGIDSYVGKVVVDQKDILHFDLGWYSSDLEEAALTIDGDVNVEKPKISWLTIDGRKAKLVQPVEGARGLTGVYIDSLWRSGSGVDRFQMSASDLKKQNKEAFIEAVKTLRFQKK